jgi:hypothetical protein
MNRKLDFRVYFMIAQLDPLILLYHDGIIRIAPNDYEKDSADVDTYITTMGTIYHDNKPGAKDIPPEEKPEFAWTLPHLEEYLIENGQA